MRPLFFGLQVIAPWPEEFPDGRILPREFRHATLAYLGGVPLEPVLEQLSALSPLPFKVGPVGHFSNSLPLPKRHPHVMSYQLQWWEPELLSSYHRAWQAWCKKKGYREDRRAYLAHVTLARGCFSSARWKRAFRPLPVYAAALNLYESLGHSKYEIRWTQALQVPFEEVESADGLVFVIYGENPTQLLHNAEAALAFKIPDLLQHIELQRQVANLDEVLEQVNALLQRAGNTSQRGFSSVASIGDSDESAGILKWRMRVDC